VPVPDEPEPAPRVLAMPSLVAELRRVAGDPARPAALREAAASRLAALAPAEPAACPDSWWGLRGWTQRAEPLVASGEPVRLSPSQVESIQRCPLQWFLRRRAGVVSAASTSQGFGTLVHALARVVVESGSLDLVDLERRLDELWPQLDWEAPWYARTERQVASKALARFADYHQAADRAVEGVEVDFTLRACGAEVRGQIDRVERDEQGRGVVVDLKTGKNKIKGADLARHPQLGLYRGCARGAPVRGHRGCRIAAAARYRRQARAVAAAAGTGRQRGDLGSRAAARARRAGEHRAVSRQAQRRLLQLRGPPLLPGAARRGAGCLTAPRP